VRLLISLLLAAALATAQTPEGRPASTNVMNAQYPRVLDDNRVIFRLNAPEAQKVAVAVGGGRYEMARAQDGLWYVTVPPQVVGFHYYSFVIDSASVNDPSSHTYFGVSRQYSGIEIPEKGVDFYLARNVPHGEVRLHYYHSKVTGAVRRAFVYTPPGYDQSAGQRYPVLYLQHGSGAKPMILVMENGYATPAGKPGLPPSATDLDRPVPRVGGYPADASGFNDVMLQDVIPMIDSYYRTVATREGRAMAGLSMGGNQTCQLTLRHLELFAWIGAFSGTGNGLSTAPLNPQTFINGVFADGAAFNAKVKLLWIGMGTAEPEPFPKAIGAFRKMLDEAGVKHVYFESPGTSHEWQTWRRSLNDFAPRLFR